jgi:hypothetical protein
LECACFYGPGRHSAQIQPGGNCAYVVQREPALGGPGFLRGIACARPPPPVHIFPGSVYISGGPQLRVAGLEGDDPIFTKKDGKVQMNGRQVTARRVAVGISKMSDQAEYEPRSEVQP